MDSSSFPFCKESRRTFCCRTVIRWPGERVKVTLLIVVDTWLSLGSSSYVLLDFRLVFGIIITDWSARLGLAVERRLVCLSAWHLLRID
jgi:hypothetical protein